MFNKTRERRGSSVDWEEDGGDLLHFAKSTESLEELPPHLRAIFIKKRLAQTAMDGQDDVGQQNFSYTSYGSMTNPKTIREQLSEADEQSYSPDQTSVGLDSVEEEVVSEL